jgi:hypothetical protein
MITTNAKISFKIEDIDLGFREILLENTLTCHIF